MLLFRSEDHIDRWCKSWRLARGSTLTIEQAWNLADAWYCDRMSPQWQRKSPEEAHAIFGSIGLAGDFWRLG